MSLLTSDYDYHLPEELIAKHPAAQRDESRMLVLDRAKRQIFHRSFRDITDYISGDDLIILNNTKVIPARLYSDDGRIELLLLEQLNATTWKSLVKPGRKMRQGMKIQIAGNTGVVLEVCEDGSRIIRWEKELDLNQDGNMPLPPYIDRASEPTDHERYQTVYAEVPGAVAAPTAGLHFTSEILARLNHTFITLHVGAGTFKPVQVENITEHPMHEEVFSISAAAAESFNSAKRKIAIGTTVVRVLESCLDANGNITPQDGRTDIFIHPPKKVASVDGLLTNFHLPKSTLMMLVSAMAGREFILEAYAEAVAENYRFYSYGDCMLIL